MMVFCRVWFLLNSSALYMYITCIIYSLFASRRSNHLLLNTIFSYTLFVLQKRTFKWKLLVSISCKIVKVYLSQFSMENNVERIRSTERDTTTYIYRIYIYIVVFIYLCTVDRKRIRRFSDVHFEKNLFNSIIYLISVFAQFLFIIS